MDWSRCLREMVACHKAIFGGHQGLKSRGFLSALIFACQISLWILSLDAWGLKFGSQRYDCLCFTAHSHSMETQPFCKPCFGRLSHSIACRYLFYYFLWWFHSILTFEQALCVFEFEFYSAHSRFKRDACYVTRWASFFRTLESHSHWPAHWFLQLACDTPVQE